VVNKYVLRLGKIASGYIKHEGYIFTLYTVYMVQFYMCMYVKCADNANYAYSTVLDKEDHDC
jgi:hypothetical protein